MYLNLNDKDFLYQQIYQDIREKIIGGELSPGDRLPSIRKMASDLNTSLNTVKRAYAKLEDEGYIKSRNKSGFYVREVGNLLVLDKADTGDLAEEVEEFTYDFGIRGVDYENFPYKALQKYFKESIDKEDMKILDRGSSKGYKPLREAIANYLKVARNIETSPKNIIISSSTESLFGLVKKLLSPQSLYAFENPGYAFGNKFYTYDLENPIPLDLDTDGVVIDKIRDFKSVCLFVTPFSQFPMGTVMSIQRRIDLLNRASLSKNRYIIEDDYDCEFKFRGFPVESLKSMDKNSDVIYFGSFSKLLAPSMRISYMILPDDLLVKYEENFRDLSNPVSTFLQKALALFIAGGEFERHLNRMKNIYRKKFDLVVEEVEKIEDLEFFTRPSSLVLVLKVGESIDIGKFKENLKENSIKIVFLKEFLYDKKSHEDLFLLGFANLSQDEIRQGLALIRKILSDSKK